MDQGEIEEIDDSVHEEIDPTVREIFDGIFAEPMNEFNERLEFIRENKFGAVWREENERNEKVMSFAKTFMQAVGGSLPSKHAEAAKHIDGSTCDLFLTYVREKLYESPLGEELFEDSCSEIKDLMTRRILKLKETLETKHDEQPKNISDLEIMIQQTDLFDPIHIHHALLCCQIAYDCKDPEHINRTLEKLDKDHLLSELAVSYVNENVPKYVMARCGDVLYVTFKGMQSHNFGRTEMSYRGEICAGIREEAKKIPLKYFAREIIQDKRIVFSGHSSGGAIASLVFLFLLEKFKHQKESFLQSRFKCITFGLMPLGGSMFKRYVEAIPGAKDCFCHIVQKNDIIPKLFGVANVTRMHEELWKLVETVLAMPLELLKANSALPTVTALFQFLVEQGPDISRRILSNFSGVDYLGIFGMYYILDTSKRGPGYSVVPAEKAFHSLRINDYENLRHMQRQYLVNHKIERYAHEVEIALVKKLPDIKKYKKSCSLEIANDITPEITEVRFENIGEEVIAKVAGSSMWFVYNVSIEGVNGNGKDLQVDVMKSTEFEVQTRMREANLVHKDQVRVRVKTHFGNSKYLAAKDVPAKTTTYVVSRRQQQLAKYSPREVIELAYLSALLERRQEGCYSKRFNAIKSFFKNAVSVVPLESLFFAMARGTPEVMFQCCEIFTTGGAIPTTIKPSEVLLSGMKQAVERIRHYQSQMRDLRSYGFRSEDVTRVIPGRRVLKPPSGAVSVLPYCRLHTQMVQDDKNLVSRWEHLNRMLNDTIARLLGFLGKYKKRGKRRYRHMVCNVNLEVFYPSSDNRNAGERKMKCCKAPMTLLTEGWKEIKEISDKILAEHSESSLESVTSKTNSMMLKALNNLRDDFKTCSTLLGAFMESQVQIPLEKAGGDNYVNKIAKHASSFGLSVWGLLILPFEYLNQMVGNLSEEFGQFVIEFSRHIHDFHDAMFPPSAHEFPDYDEKLEFLVGSMKQSWTCNQEYVSYSLERQLEDQCTKRNIFHDTPVDDILNQWHANFEDETLTLVPNEYRPLVARWIKWSLMINRLRESLACQTAVGVIGLVNSGKSKFVRSMFGKEAITGTTDHKRTTVPLIYNLNPEIKGMDVIDFPGVDDRDESIPQLAELLLSLTRIIVFVVDYRRAHTKSTREWLGTLARINVPVLVCLTFADKLYAELMGKNEDCDAEKLKSGVEDQLKTIKELIGQPESGCRRDFKFTVFAFDNDSKLDCEEGKEKLRKAGLSDESDVGRWIAEKLQDYEQNDVSQNILTFIEGKEKSTLNSNRRTPTPVPLAEDESGDASRNDEKSGVNEAEARADHQPSSKSNS